MQPFNMIQMHDNKLVAFHIYNKNDYSYLLDQGHINSIQLDDKLCLFRFQQSKWAYVPTIVIAHMFCASRDTQDSYISTFQ